MTDLLFTQSTKSPNQISHDNVLQLDTHCAGKYSNFHCIFYIFKTCLICNNGSKNGINLGNYDVFNNVKRIENTQLQKNYNGKVFLNMYTGILIKLIVTIYIEDIEFYIIIIQFITITL